MSNTIYAFGKGSSRLTLIELRALMRVLDLGFADVDEMTDEDKRQHFDGHFNAAVRACDKLQEWRNVAEWTAKRKADAAGGSS